MSSAISKGCSFEMSSEWQYGQLGDHVSGACIGNAASALSHCVGPPLHFIADMPTTQRTLLGSGAAGFFDLAGFSTRPDLAGFSLAQQSAGSCSSGGASGALREQQQPPSLHCSTVPQPHTCWPQACADCAGASG